MSVSAPTLLTAAVTSTTEAALATGSFTPTAKALIVVYVAASTTAATAAITFSISDTLGGLTWTKVEAATGGTHGTTATMFWAIAPTSPTAGTVTVTPSATGVAGYGMSVSAYQMTGASGVGATASSTSATGVTTLSSVPAQGSLLVGQTVHSTSTAGFSSPTMPTGFTASFTKLSVLPTFSTGGYGSPGTTQAKTYTFGTSGFQPNCVSVLMEVLATPTSARAAWPAVSVGVAFTAGAFTEVAQGASAGAPVSLAASRGRQYELDRMEAGTGKASFENFDGRYTPGNASSPYAGLLALYNEYRVRATWSGTTYDVVRAFIERWPTDYSDSGNFAWTNVDAVDAFALLANQKARSVADYEVLADSPTYLYKLDEPSDSTTAGDSINPGVNPSAFRRDGKFGAATVAFGAATPLADGATGVSFGSVYTYRTSDIGFVTGANAHVSILAISDVTRQGPVIPGASAFSVEYWIVTPTTAPDPAAVGPAYIATHGADTASFNRGVSISINAGSGTVGFLGIGGTATVSNTAATSNSTSICDGKLHHIVVSLDSDLKTMHLYVDGALAGTSVASTGSALDFSGFVRNHIGGLLLAGGSAVGSQFPGVVCRAALYPTSLSAARVLAHYTSGKTAFSGEDTGARVSRVLGYAGWPVALTDVTSGFSFEGPAIIEGTSILEVLQNAASDELGTLWVSGAGKVTFRGRQVRAATLTSSVTFGENSAGGEIPYLEDVHFDYDPTLVYDQVQVSRDTGATVFVQAATSVLPYHKTLTKSVGLSTDAEASDEANWLVAALSTPKLRVAALSIQPSANTALWPVALGTEINTRVTVKRRAINQPQFSIDCWVEAIAHTITATGWKTTFLLSPVDSPRMNLWDTDNWDDTTAVWGF